MGINSDVYAADVNIDILSATVKDKRIEGASMTLQRNGAQSVSGTTNASGSVNLGSTFADDQDALLIVKKEGYSNLVVKWMLMIRIAMDQKLSLSAKSILAKVTSMPCRTIAIKGCPTVIISLPVRQKCLFM